MLFTRCPNCETTFRITADTLRVASGAVRCGNCATVYSAFSGLRQETLDPGMQAGEDFLSPTMQTQELAAIEEIASPDIADAPTVGDASVEVESAADAPLASEPTSTLAAADDEPVVPIEPVEPVLDSPIADRPTALPADAPVELAIEESAAEPVIEGGVAAEAIVPAEMADDAPAAVDSGATSGALRFELPEDDEWSQVLREIEETTHEKRDTVASSDDRDADWEEPDDDDSELEPHGTPAEFFDIGEPDSLAGLRHAGSPQSLLGPDAEVSASGDAGVAGAMAVSIDAELDVELSDDYGAGEAPISAEEVDATLSSEPDADFFAALQTPLGAGSPSGERRLLWRIGAAAMAALLVVQLVHYNRALLATQSGVGPLLQTMYEAFGVALLPDWDLDQYEISNWAASAGETEAGIGNLRITAQIRNGGPAPQPYPSIQLELKDRWETVIGRRIFTPHEYLGVDFDTNTLMPAGETVPAELAVVDPGLDASGFELDVCVASSNASYRCAADRVFD